MRVANIGDMHAKGKDLDAFSRQFQAAIEACCARNVDLIAIGGDVFESSQIGDRHASTGAIERAVLDPLWDFGPSKIVAIRGNHDQAGPGSVDALSCLSAIGVECYSVPGICTFSSASAAIYCLPWDWTPGANPMEALDKLIADNPPQNYKTTLLLAHVGVVGARMSTRKVCESVNGWTITREYLEDLPFARVALSHYHCRQDLTNGRGGFVGALRQLDHGEEGNPAGFEVWDTETGAVKWIEMDEAPRYRTAVVCEEDAWPRPGANEILRVHADGWRATRAQRLEIEQAGGTVEDIIDYEERQARSEVPPGVVGCPMALLDLWLDNRNADMTAEERAELAEELAAVIADSNTGNTYTTTDEDDDETDSHAN